MNIPNSNKQNPMNPNHNPESDLHLEDALTSFRNSIHAWSDHELSRRPAATLAQPSRQTSHSSSSFRHWLMAPAVSWAAAAALAIGAVGVPLGIRQHNAAIAVQHAANEARQRQLLEEQKAAQLAAITVTNNKAEDDLLLQHVDTDIAQDTPDAMQPLASLMGSAAGTDSGSGSE